MIETIGELRKALAGFDDTDLVNMEMSGIVACIGRIARDDNGTATITAGDDREEEFEDDE